MPVGEFLQRFIAVERQLRELYRSRVMDQADVLSVRRGRPLSAVEMARALKEVGVLSQDLFELIGNVTKTRNAVVHGHTDDVGTSALDGVKEIRRRLSRIESDLYHHEPPEDDQDGDVDEPGPGP